MYLYQKLLQRNNSQIGWKTSPLERWFGWWPLLTSSCASPVGKSEVHTLLQQNNFTDQAIISTYFLGGGVCWILWDFSLPKSRIKRIILLRTYLQRPQKLKHLSFMMFLDLTADLYALIAKDWDKQVWDLKLEQNEIW